MDLSTSYPNLVIFWENQASMIVKKGSKNSGLNFYSMNKQRIFTRKGQRKKCSQPVCSIGEPGIAGYHSKRDLTVSCKYCGAVVI